MLPQMIIWKKEPRYSDMKDILKLDLAAFADIAGLGVNPEEMTPVTKWLDIEVNPKELVFLLDVIRGIFRDSKRIAFLIHKERYAAVFANIKS